VRDFWSDTKGNVKGTQLKLAATNSTATAGLGDAYSLASWGAANSAPNQFKTNVEREEPAKLRRYLFSAGLLPCRAATDVAA
jgi:hypothetical protein